MSSFPASAGAERCFAAMDALAARGEDFVFAVDYALERAFVLPLRDADPARILFDFRGRGNAGPGERPRAASGRDGARPDRPPRAAREARILACEPVPYDDYERAFRVIREGEERGDSFLANLTFPTRVSLSLPLRAVFGAVSAPYRLWLGPELAGGGTECLVFSPEPFVRLEGSTITTCPMKGTKFTEAPGARLATAPGARTANSPGTVSAEPPGKAPVARPDAALSLLGDAKEAAEHATVVDLLRNDLALVARDVEVARYRYVEEAGSGAEALLQTSSEIRGELEPEFAGRPGSVLSRLLPAGSVTGAPKRSTVALIARAEGGGRGWYCGVCGTWRGGSLDSAVMIRFVESGPGGTFFRSGGGVTVYSEPRAEYAELLAKVRLPR